MPVTFRRAGLDTFIEGIKRKIESPDLIVELGNSLSQNLVAAVGSSGLSSKSGSIVKALSKVGEPERTPTGWRIGVGDAKATGLPSDPAPRGTLRAFFTDNPGVRPSPWRGIPPNYQDVLERMRRAGMYGGRGADYANYMWVQDKGNTKAHISPRGFINTGFTTWKAQVPGIIERHLGRIV